LLLVSGLDFNEKTLVSSNRVWLISLDTEAVYSAKDIESLKSEMKTNKVVLPSIDIDPIEVFFDRQLISHLKSHSIYP
jgi:hypothetical protein